MVKSVAIKIRLESTAGTGYFYVTKKNPKTHKTKISFRKYDPVVRKHVEFKEKKNQIAIDLKNVCYFLLISLQACGYYVLLFAKI